jgi:hypothetical protein
MMLGRGPDLGQAKADDADVADRGHEQDLLTALMPATIATSASPSASIRAAESMRQPHGDAGRTVINAVLTK